MSFAGVSLTVDGKASGSAWDIAADSSDSGYHLFVVRGYSRTKDDTPNGKSIESQQFRVGGYRWLIDYYPNGCEDCNIDFISFYLSLDEEDGRPVDEHVTFQFGFSFIDQVEMQEASSIRTSGRWNLSDDEYWGYPCFVTRRLFERSGHLKNDSFTVRCDIIVTRTANAADERSSSSSSVVVSPPPCIQQHLGGLLLSGEGADVTFEDGGETFVAHRCVLAARSPVFRAGLLGPMKEGTTTSAIRIDDMEPKVFRLLLRFIYCDSLPEILSASDNDDDYCCDDVMMMWQHLLVAADIYDLRKLKLVCEESLCDSIEATTVAGILALAEQHNCQGLKDACLDFGNSLREEENKTRDLVLKLEDTCLK
ncbi:hypothetical protein C2845_PM02G13470 [Panicum miliaceum]|uniref:BTB/POZ and MATH domain-containing protein 1-like n=1 Tax=Panicum miliaceum TaxID=4540 RepID=A0A3L6S5V6_PANMI|nr:hypothetical protein C2845_PM02G13470 [Panicum miliaceum]